MKKLTVRQMAVVKRVAQNVSSLVDKKAKALSKIHQLENEIATLDTEISGHEVGIKTLTDGYTSEDLVVKQVENKFNTKGEEVKATKYVPSDIVVYSEEDKCYYIKDNEVQLESPNSAEEVDDSRLEETEEKPSDEGAFNPIEVVE